MKKCILTVGVSASGKTTWAENFIKEMAQQNELWININRDDIRRVIFFEKTGEKSFSWKLWHKKCEKEAYERWNQEMDRVATIPNLIGVIISDTNINSKIRQFIADKFEKENFAVEYRHFPISYEEAVKRDLTRANPVGCSVIAEQIEKYWSQFEKRYVPDTQLPEAVIVDVDGTLAHSEDVRDVFDWTKVCLDKPNALVVNVVRGLKSQGIHIVVISGRDDVCKKETWEWLVHELGFNPSDLFMRVAGDKRKDCIIKKEIFFSSIAPKYHVIGAIDDRPQVLMGCWRPMGIQVLVAGSKNPYIWF